MVKVLKEVSETISGCLPVQKRNQFQKMLDDAVDQGAEHVLVESSRAIARDANVAEDLLVPQCPAEQVADCRGGRTGAQLIRCRRLNEAGVAILEANHVRLL